MTTPRFVQRRPRDSGGERDGRFVGGATGRRSGRRDRAALRVRRAAVGMPTWHPSTCPRTVGHWGCGRRELDGYRALGTGGRRRAAASSSAEIPACSSRRAGQRLRRRRGASTRRLLRGRAGTGRGSNGCDRTTQRPGRRSRTDTLGRRAIARPLARDGTTLRHEPDLSQRDDLAWSASRVEAVLRGRRLDGRRFRETRLRRGRVRSATTAGSATVVDGRRSATGLVVPGRRSGLPAPRTRTELGLPEAFTSFRVRLLERRRKNPRRRTGASMRRPGRACPGSSEHQDTTGAELARSPRCRREASSTTGTFRWTIATPSVAACAATSSLHRSDGLGLTLAEAMASGKPVIATSCQHARTREPPRALPPRRTSKQLGSTCAAGGLSRMSVRALMRRVWQPEGARHRARAGPRRDRRALPAAANRPPSSPTGWRTRGRVGR